MKTNDTENKAKRDWHTLTCYSTGIHFRAHVDGWLQQNRLAVANVSFSPHLSNEYVANKLSRAKPHKLVVTNKEHFDIPIDANLAPAVQRAAAERCTNFGGFRTPSPKLRLCSTFPGFIIIRSRVFGGFSCEVTFRKLHNHLNLG